MIALCLWAFLRWDESCSKTFATALVINYEGEEARTNMSFDAKPEDLDIEQSGQILKDSFNQQKLHKILTDLELKTPELGELKS